MEQVRRPAVPGWYWAVALVALLWEAVGCYAYLTQVGMDAGQMGRLPPEQVAVWRAMPIWVWCAYAVATWIGLSGAFLLLMRRRLARPAFAISLIAVLIQFGWVFLASPALQTIGTSAAAFPAFIVLAGAALLWFADLGTKRGWLL